MPSTIPNLWPEQFNVDVQSPAAILRVQANYLAKVTSGILQGTVETESAEERVQHRLVVTAPAYNMYRHTLLTAEHDAHLPYPAEVRAEALMSRDDFNEYYPSASGDEEMQELVAKALKDTSTIALIHSLIAKSNESTQSRSDAATAKATSHKKAAASFEPVS